MISELLRLVIKGLPPSVNHTYKTGRNGNRWVTLSPALKELEREYLSGELKHGDNPVLRWMAANMVVKKDSAENYVPDKARSIDRIDGIVALCVAISRQINAREEAPSVYESRGLLLI